jgi:hypothetical protein
MNIKRAFEIAAAGSHNVIMLCNYYTVAIIYPIFVS